MEGTSRKRSQSLVSSKQDEGEEVNLAYSTELSIELDNGPLVRAHLNCNLWDVDSTVNNNAQQHTETAVLEVYRPVVKKVNIQHNNQSWVEPRLFHPFLGMKVQKMFNGEPFLGTVIKAAEMVTQDDKSEPEEDVKMWQVKFEDDDIEDMTWGELLRCRLNRPRIPAPCCGRQFQMLEIFSGMCLAHQTLKQAASFTTF